MDIYSPTINTNCVMIGSYLMAMLRMGIVIIIIRFCGMTCELLIFVFLVCIFLWGVVYVGHSSENGNWIVICCIMTELKIMPLV